MVKGCYLTLTDALVFPPLWLTGGWVCSPVRLADEVLVAYLGSGSSTRVGPGIAVQTFVRGLRRRGANVLIAGVGKPIAEGRDVAVVGVREGTVLMRDGHRRAL